MWEYHFGISFFVDWNSKKTYKQRHKRFPVFFFFSFLFLIVSKKHFNYLLSAITAN